MSIQTRSVFYDESGGLVRFWDWAIVTTTLGTMAEPFMVNARPTDGEDWDPEDEINRIDHIRGSPRDQAQLILSGGSGHVLNGGNQMPRNGP